MSEELLNTLQIIFSAIPALALIRILIFEDSDKAIRIFRAKLTLIWLIIFCGVQVGLYVLNVPLVWKVAGTVLVVVMGGILYISMLVFGGLAMELNPVNHL